MSMCYCEVSGCFKHAEKVAEYLGERTKICPEHAKQIEKEGAKFMHDKLGMIFKMEVGVKIHD